MSWSVPAIRDALKAALETVPGLRGYDTMAGVVNPPAAVVVPGEPFISYDDTMGDDKATLRFEIVVVVGGTPSDRTTQDALDILLAGSGAGSARAALLGDLGGVVDDCNVGSATSYGVFTFGANDYLGAKLQAEVMV